MLQFSNNKSKFILISQTALQSWTILCAISVAPRFNKGGELQNVAGVLRESLSRQRQGGSGGGAPSTQQIFTVFTQTTLVSAQFLSEK